jgi:lipopolysaccharide transport system permease protein
VNQPSLEYEIVIRPTRSWFQLGIGDLWHYRDLLLILVHRDFSAKYKQTILGPAWFVLQPLLTTLIFTVIFGQIAKIPTDGLPPVLFYMAGLVAWNYFAQTFQTTSATLVTNAALFGKVYFPRLIVPLAAVVSNLIAFALQLGTFLCLWLYYKFLTPASGFTISPAIVYFPLLLVQLAALSLGAGLWMSSLTVKYRDFVHLSAFLIQLWMFATPVIYPFSQIPEAWRWVAALNPMALPVEAMRYMFLGKGIIAPTYLSISVSVTLVILLSGAMLFSRVERTFVDTV